MRAERETHPQPATSDLQDGNSVAVWLHNSMAVQHFWPAHLTMVQVAYLIPMEFFFMLFYAMSTITCIIMFFVLLTIKPHPPKKMNNFSVMKLKKKHRSWDSTSCPTNKINEEPVRRPSW